MNSIFPEKLNGSNWGELKLEDKEIVFDDEGFPLFSFPYSKISNSTALNKNEIILDFNQDDNGDTYSVLLFRDFITNIRIQAPEITENKEVEGEENPVTVADTIISQIQTKTGLGEFSGDIIAIIPEAPFVVPRGKYQIDIFKDFINLHGSTYNYRIDFKSISRAFLLPKPDDVQMAFVIALEKSIRQGNTTYPYLVMNFKKDMVETIKIKLKPEEITQFYGDAISEEVSGPLYDILAKLFKIIIGVNIIVPGNFKSHSGQCGFRCSIKAQEGVLFPLPKSLMFIQKPVIHIRIDEIGIVRFHRAGNRDQNKLFDIEIRTSKGSPQTFVGIDKQEYSKITEYFNSRKVKIEIVDETSGLKALYGDDDESDDDEEADNGIPDEDDDDDEDDESFKGEEDGNDDSDDDEEIEEEEGND